MLRYTSLQSRISFTAFMPIAALYPFSVVGAPILFVVVIPLDVTAAAAGSAAKFAFGDKTVIEIIVVFHSMFPPYFLIEHKLYIVL